MAALFQMENYPNKEDVQDGDHKTCQVPGCGKTFKKFKYLVDHLKGGKHRVPAELIQQHWLQEEHRIENRAPPETLGKNEANFVDVAIDPVSGQVVEDRFCCRVCRCDYQKQSVVSHMAIHGQDATDVRRWLTAVDGNLFRNGSSIHDIADRLHLTRAMYKESPLHTSSSSEGPSPSASPTRRTQPDRQDAVKSHSVMVKVKPDFNPNAVPSVVLGPNGNSWRPALIRCDHAGTVVDGAALRWTEAPCTPSRSDASSGAESAKLDTKRSAAKRVKRNGGV